MISGLLAVAWIGQQVHNLLLTYLIGKLVSVPTWPPRLSHQYADFWSEIGFLCPFLKIICNCSDSWRRCDSESQLWSTGTRLSLSQRCLWGAVVSCMCSGMLGYKMSPDMTLLSLTRLRGNEVLNRICVRHVSLLFSHLLIVATLHWAQIALFLISLQAPPTHFGQLFISFCRLHFFERKMPKDHLRRVWIASTIRVSKD